MLNRFLTAELIRVEGNGETSCRNELSVELEAVEEQYPLVISKLNCNY